MTESPDQLNTEILRLVATIRQIDQKIFRMSQCPSWEQMRPIFAELVEDTMRRMHSESDRIRMLMIPEIRKAYLDNAVRLEPPAKQIEGPKK